VIDGKRLFYLLCKVWFLILVGKNYAIMN